VRARTKKGWKTSGLDIRKGDQTRNSHQGKKEVFSTGIPKNRSGKTNGPEVSWRERGKTGRRIETISEEKGVPGKVVC